MDKEAWHAVIHGVAKSRTWLSNWTELTPISSLFYFIYFFCSYFSPHFSLHFPFWSTFLPCGFPNVLFFFFSFLTFTELLAMYRECFFFFIKKHFCSTEEKCRACYLLKGFLSISNDPKLSSYSLPTQFCSSE